MISFLFATCDVTNNPDFIRFKWRLKRKHFPAKCFIRTTEIRQKGSAFTWLGLSEIRQIQLHGFGDTSSKAYAAVIYLRFILIDG